MNDRMHHLMKGGVSALLLAELVSCTIPSAGAHEPLFAKSAGFQEAVPPDPDPEPARARPRFYMESSLGFGEISIDVDGSSDSDASAVLFQAAGEFLSEKNIGGGIRLWWH